LRLSVPLLIFASFRVDCPQRRHIGAGTAIAAEFSVGVKHWLAASPHVHQRAVAAHRAIYEVTKRFTGIERFPNKAPLLRLRLKIESVIPAHRPDSIGCMRTKCVLGQHCEFAVGTNFPKPVGSGFGIIAELRLALPQCFFGALALRHIDLCRDNLDKFPACGERRSDDCFEVFDRSIGKYDSIRGRVASFLAHSALDFCVQPVRSSG
jgi:hypothetical protein